METPSSHSEELKNIVCQSENAITYYWICLKVKTAQSRIWLQNTNIEKLLLSILAKTNPSRCYFIHTFVDLIILGVGLETYDPNKFFGELKNNIQHEINLIQTFGKINWDKGSIRKVSKADLLVLKNLSIDACASFGIPLHCPAKLNKDEI